MCRIYSYVLLALQQVSVMWMLRGIVTIVAFIDVVKNDKFQQIVVMSILLLKPLI